MAQQAEVRLDWHYYVLLTPAVWCIYVGDRLWDVRRMVKLNQATARHQFYCRHRGVFWLLLGLALSLGFVLSLLTLSPLVWAVAASVVLGVAGYFWQLQGRLLIPKELACGAIFSVGVICPLAGHWSAELLVHALLFGGLCAANCLAIAQWEGEPDAVNDPNASTRAMPWLNQLLPWSLVMLILGGGMLGTWMGLSLALGAVALGLLLLLEKRMDRELLRVLADFCLFSPIPVYLCLQLWS